MKSAVYRSPTGELVLRLMDEKGLECTAILSRTEHAELVKRLEQAAGLGAPVDWADLEYDEETAAVMRHTVVGLPRKLMIQHGQGDKLRATAELGHAEAKALAGHLGRTLEQQESGQRHRLLEEMPLPWPSAKT